MLPFGLFCLALAVASTYWPRSKRWWGGHGYRVRIIRRNSWISVGALLFLGLGIYLPGRMRAGRPPAAEMLAPQTPESPSITRTATPTPHVVEAPSWPAPDTPILGLRMTVGVEETRQAEDDAPVYLHCGAERWPVKTLSDPDAEKVNFNPVPATISELTALPAPPTLPPDHRIVPVELTTYVVRARLLAGC